MDYVKAHGAGNDFVLLPDLDDRFTLDADLTRALCAPHTGLGADGVIRLGRARNDRDDVFMDYRNADGGVAEMCGNGVRCVAKYVLDRNVVGGDEVRVDTRGGSKTVHVAGRHADGLVAELRVDMGEPTVATIDWRPSDARAPDGPTSENASGPALRLTSVDMGNPHAVYLTDDVAGTPLAQVAAQINQLPEFPEGVNVEAVEVRDRTRLRGRIFERGVGETMASGTGASAMVVAAITRGLADDMVTVAVPGGELVVEWSGSVAVTGPAVEVAHGTLDATWLTTIR